MMGFRGYATKITELSKWCLYDVNLQHRQTLVYPAVLPLYGELVRLLLGRLVNAPQQDCTLNNRPQRFSLTERLAVERRESSMPFIWDASASR
jgi:hypothetical protein